MTIKFTTNEIRYIALFESMTGAMVKDCIVDDENGKITFLVKKGDMGLAIGKRGSTVTKVQKTVDKGVEVIEHSEDPVEFISNLMAPAQLRSVRILQRESGKKLPLWKQMVKIKGPLLVKAVKTLKEPDYWPKDSITLVISL